MIPEIKKLYNNYKSVEAKKIVDCMFGVIQKSYKWGLLGEPFDMDYILGAVGSCADDSEYICKINCRLREQIDGSGEYIEQLKNKLKGI